MKMSAQGGPRRISEVANYAVDAAREQFLALATSADTASIYPPHDH
jgi:hypothetical protein